MPKRRANGEGNIRKRKDGRWEGRYTVGHDPETGKAIIKNVLGKTQAEVKEKLKKAIEENVGIDHEHETFLEAGHIAQEEGCKAVTLHARTTAEYYGGHSDWSRIGELVEALDIPVFGNGDIWGANDALAMVAETGCAGVAIGRGCQGRPWLFADIKNAFAGSDKRVDPTLGDVCRVVERHAELLTEFYDGDEQMAVHDLRKHIAWYLKGFPVGGSTRRAFMECENLEDVRAEIGKLDPNICFPERVVDKPRGRVRFAKKVHLPYGWLESRETTHDERQALFGDDPMDASY